MSGTASQKKGILPGASADIKRMAITYPGGKGGAGVHQNIINLIPKHKVYVEACIGAGFIVRYKKPAEINIGLDIDPEVIKYWTRGDISKIIDIPRGKVAGSNTHKKGYRILRTSPEFSKSGALHYFDFINIDAVQWIEDHIEEINHDWFIYVDPPYKIDTRKGGKLYRYEMTDFQHIQLLNILQATPANIMISGYWSSLYNDMLQGWNTFNFKASTRNGMATEWLWFNYKKPDHLHDYRYIGSDFKKREAIRNKRKRWVSRFSKLPAAEKNAMFEEFKIILNQKGVDHD
jgi:site-specific DNA-adenine methylase